MPRHTAYPKCKCRYETEGGGGFTNEGMPPSYDYFSCGVRGGDDGLDEIAGPALDSEDAEGESTRRAQVGVQNHNLSVGKERNVSCVVLASKGLINVQNIFMSSAVVLMGARRCV